MVVMQRSAPEKPGHPVRISVQEHDVCQLQKRGWFVVPSEDKPEVNAPVDDAKDVPSYGGDEVTVQVEKNDAPDAGKPRRGGKRHEV